MELHRLCDTVVGWLLNDDLQDVSVVHSDLLFRIPGFSHFRNMQKRLCVDEDNKSWRKLSQGAGPHKSCFSFSPALALRMLSEFPCEPSVTIRGEVMRRLFKQARASPPAMPAPSNKDARLLGVLVSSLR